MRHHRLLSLIGILAVLLTGCTTSEPIAQGAAQAVTATWPAAAPQPTHAPTDEPPTVTPEPAPTSAPEPTAVPAPRVGIQAGHWKLENLPDEMQQFRTWSGSYVRGYDEWEINLPIAQAVQQQLEAAGVQVDLLPTVIPIGYTADAFVSIHADGVSGAQAGVRHGWKIATPYRASPASEALAAAVQDSYERVTELPPDPRGASVDMRAYYAFASYRYWHSIAPTTPAVIIETGFMTYPTDWNLLYKRPEVVAQGIAEGVLAYLHARDPNDTAARQPVNLPMLKPKAANTPLYQYGNLNSPVARRLAAGQLLVPLATREGWYLVLTRGPWDIGWVRTVDVDITDVPQVPLTSRPDE
ncbi:MAG TPA: N-acetylmuramoyl-L-alanine amidase [Roseiflexaceae bacterium]|nr:N-acetylmuramoyl-L-alanine amidase [Roseiflexaceae bacterium]